MDVDEARAVLERVKKLNSESKDSSESNEDVQRVFKWAYGLSGAESAIKRWTTGEETKKMIPSDTMKAVEIAMELSDIRNAPSQIKHFERLAINLAKKDPDDITTSESTRALYCDVEMFRLAFTSRPYVCKYLTLRRRMLRKKEDVGSIDKQNRGIKEAMERLDQVRDKLAQKPIKRGILETIVAMIRTIVVALWIFLAVPLLMILSIVRLSHPMLRRMGLHNGTLPLDMISRCTCRVVLVVLGIKVAYTGITPEFLNGKGTIAMFTHASNIDPFVLSAGPLSFKWVGKKALFMIPFFGWVMSLWGHIPIDRKNLQKAKQAINGTVVSKIRKWGRSVAISPEGTRSRIGRILDFKKGPFHLACNVRLPVTPIYLDGPWQIWRPGTPIAYSGVALAAFLEPIELEVSSSNNDLDEDVKIKEAEIAQLSAKVHRALLLRSKQGGVESLPKNAIVEDFRDTSVLILGLAPFIFYSILYFLIFR
mmetsp:Transcript_2897/g.4235  ORF Transcript_2897/g.4235 Transcript_2897/m.4235 type:complete len:480 (-) Transcript_2897:218-1657(-)